jgi:hypothetical protein
VVDDVFGDEVIEGAGVPRGDRGDESVVGLPDAALAHPDMVPGVALA